MLDADLADLYGVATKALNQAVKRNSDRFPLDFMFRLNEKEKTEVVTNCDHLARLKYSPNRPSAFTEYGAVMLANVLNSPRAIRTSVQIVRVFIRLREAAITHKDLSKRIDDLERKYDTHFKAVFDAIRRLMEPPAPPRKRIGFVPEKD